MNKEAIPDGLKSEVFKRIVDSPARSIVEAMVATLVTDDDGKTITEIKVRRAPKMDESRRVPQPDVWIQKVEDGHVTFTKFERDKFTNTGRQLPLKTLPVAADVKVVFATVNEATRKIEVGEAIPGGLQHELFKRTAKTSPPGIDAWLVTDAAGEKITEIQVYRSLKPIPFLVPNSAKIREVDNGEVTFSRRVYDKYTNTLISGEPKTLPVAPNIKLRIGRMDAATKKIEYTAEIPDGIMGDQFKKARMRSVWALVTTDDSGTVITEICIMQSAPQKKEK